MINCIENYLLQNHVMVAKFKGVYHRHIIMPMVFTISIELSNNQKHEMEIFSLIVKFNMIISTEMGSTRHCH